MSAVDEQCLDSDDPITGTQCTETVPVGTMDATETAMFMTYDTGIQDLREACGITDI